MVWGLVAVMLYTTGSTLAMALSLSAHGMAALIPWAIALLALSAARAYGSLAEGILVGGLAMLLATLSGLDVYSLGVASSLASSMLSLEMDRRSVATLAVLMAAVLFLGLYSWLLVSSAGDSYRIPVWLAVSLLAASGVYLFGGTGGYGGLGAASLVSSLSSGLARRGQVLASFILMGLISAVLALGRNGLSLVLAWIVFVYVSSRRGPVFGVVAVLIVLSMLMHFAGVGLGFGVIDAVLGG